MTDTLVLEPQRTNIQAANAQNIHQIPEGAPGS